jgi:hypothetical protein
MAKKRTTTGPEHVNAPLTFTGLHDAGLDRPIPLYPNSKKPMGDGWNGASYSREQYEAFDQTDCGIGLLCQNVVGLDIDLVDEGHAKAIERIIRRTLKLPKSTPRRVGNAPKCLLMMRVDAPLPSFDLKHGRAMLFQLLGATSAGPRQFVACGIHPDTNLPYEWTVRPGSHADLPLLTPEGLVALREAVTQGLTELGYAVGNTGGRKGKAKGNGAWSERRPWSANELEQARAELHKHDPDMLRPDWIALGMAIADGTHGSEEGFGLWDEWSSGSPKYKPDEIGKDWRSFKPGPITKATLFKNDFLKRTGQVDDVNTEPREQQQHEQQHEQPQAGKTSGAAPPPPGAGQHESGEAVGSNLRAIFVRKVSDVPWIIAGMAAPGAMLVVGRPKGGKSLLTTDMVFAVASGAEFLGRKSTQSDVLWIAAEDDDDQQARRLQKRSPGVEVPGNVTVLTSTGLKAVSAKQPEEMALHEWLDGYLARHRGVRHAVIDTQTTAETIWGGDTPADAELRRSKNVVKAAYASARVYQDIGLKHGVCIVLVHHSRKRNGKDVSDYHELINMPQTVVAGVTSSVVLADLPNSDPHEPSNKRVLAVRGRHAPDSTQIVVLGPNLQYTLEGDYRDVTRSALRNEIMASIEALQGTGEDLVPLGDVAAECDSTVGSIKVALSQMRKTPDGLRWKGRVLETKPGRGGGVRFVLQGT